MTRRRAAYSSEMIEVISCMCIPQAHNVKRLKIKFIPENKSHLLLETNCTESVISHTITDVMCVANALGDLSNSPS